MCGSCPGIAVPAGGRMLWGLSANGSGRESAAASRGGATTGAPQDAQKLGSSPTICLPHFVQNMRVPLAGALDGRGHERANDPTLLSPQDGGASLEVRTGSNSRARPRPLTAPSGVGPSTSKGPHHVQGQHRAPNGSVWEPQLPRKVRKYVLPHNCELSSPPGLRPCGGSTPTS